jgi:ATP-dependent Clp protease ATP-binding subunit ClpA
VTADVVLVALLAGLAGGAAGGVVIGALQAWMAGGKGMGRIHLIGHHGPEMGVSDTATATSPGADPFHRFGARGKRVLALAQEEATRQKHNYIGTEHLLAALLRDGDTIAARALTSLGVDLVKVRTALEFIVGRGESTTSPSEITLSPRTKKVIELATDEARRLGQPEAGPEHILLGLVDEGEGIASGILESLGLRLETVRAQVVEQLAASGAPPAAGYAPPSSRRRPLDRFSERSKRALAHAQGEAMQMGHRHIGPEHLLLGIARLDEPAHPDETVKRVLAELGLTLERLRAELAKVSPPLDQDAPPREIGLTPETTAIFDLARREAGADQPILPEHFLLALVRDDRSVAAQILARLGATPERVRRAVGG